MATSLPRLLRAAIPGVFAAGFLFSTTATAGPGPSHPTAGAIDILAQSAASDWRPIDPENTLYLELGSGRVVIELAPEFAPLHVANLKALVRGKYFDGLGIVRVADNYLTEWEDSTGKRPTLGAATSLPAEFSGSIRAEQAFTRLPDGDVYAPQVGFSGGFPVARDPKSGERWLVHCYGMLGLGRDDATTSGFGGSPFVVIGDARNLDRNDTLLGHVVDGIELLSTLPRGPSPRGFYGKPADHIPIRAMRVAADVPARERTEVEVLRTDTATFKAYVEARRNPPKGWYVQPAGHVDVCSVRVASRRVAPAAAK
jgi:cyclophilin family peptidyl-prolyl cis-trans isomerase